MSFGGDVLLCSTHEGVNLARKNNADRIKPKSFPPLGELLERLREAGVRIGTCPPSGMTHAVTEDNMLPNASWMGAAAMIDGMQGRQNTAGQVRHAHPGVAGGIRVDHCRVAHSDLSGSSPPGAL